MTPPLRKLAYRPIKWKVSLDPRIAGRVELALSNAAGTGPIRGSRSKLVNALLEMWLDGLIELREVADSPAEAGEVSDTSHLVEGSGKAVADAPTVGSPSHAPRPATSHHTSGPLRHLPKTEQEKLQKG